jgi:glycosyltransferase involved in cell wall biosynthesis
MNDLISVIMPVYNVENYLAQSIESVLNQDHRELELILIDDGSTDGSGSICDAYAAEDHRVKLIHQKNGGAASAKNSGLRIASGTASN